MNGARGVSINCVTPRCLASIRFFDAAGDFMTGIQRCAGGALPGALQAVQHPGAGEGSQLIFASRSPNEVLLVCNQLDALTAMEAFAANRTDGCVVNQTGAWKAWEIGGDRAADFWSRLSSTALPAVGEARMSRVAELTAMTLSVRPGTAMVLIDRLYADHFANWISATAADF